MALATSSVPSERDVVSNYLLERIASAFLKKDFEEASSLTRFHAVLMGMSDQEYLETV